MDTNKMREEFEAGWGYTNEEQNIYFIPELNMYGSEGVSRAASSKSSAWIYFQRGWKSARSSLVIELPDDGIEDAREANPGISDTFDAGYNFATNRFVDVLEGLGLEVAP